MRFRHDPVKAAANLKKHKVSSPTLKAYLRILSRLRSKIRTQKTNNGLLPSVWATPVKCLIVVWTERGDECRVISARRATRKERKDYEG